MSSTDTRTGFRLPWSSDRTNHDGRPSEPEAEPEAAAPDAVAPAPDGAAPDAAAPVEDPSGDAPDGSAEERPEAAAWPDTDVLPRLADVEPEGPPAAEADLVDAPEAPAPRADTHRRPTKFLADLTAAMRAAAESGRDQTLAQLRTDAKQVIDSIHEVSATEATTLRKAADEDVAGVREWSKAEIARIREETEARIAQRRQSLEGELKDHADGVARRIETIEGAIGAFESEMAAFFEQLLGESDPARFAALAERMPEPPSIEGFTNPDVAGEWSGAGESTPATAQATTDAGGAAAALVEDDASAVGSDETDARAAVWAGAIAPDPEPGAVAVADNDELAADGAPAPATGFAEGQIGEPGSGGAPADGFEADGTPVDRSAIMAALEAAAEAVVAAEAAAESASQAEVAADLAETAAELLSSRIDEGEGWGDLDAAEAEAALAARMDAGGIESESFVDRLAGLMPRAELGDGEPRTSQIIVTGLVSVASIASFKRHLGRVSGVSGVTVASGHDGAFVFTATHRPDVSFRDVVPSLPGFGARVTNAADGVVNVTAHDPESDG